MKIETLISTVNLKSNSELIKKLNVKGNSITINQAIDPNYKIIPDIKEGKNLLFSYKEKGLSRSRNKAIEKSTADICVVADDDLYYVDDSEDIIKKSYEKYKDADIIAFYVNYERINRHKKMLKEGRIGHIKSMRLSSVQITFKRKSIVDNNIRLDERFGTGSTYYCGEENIFLFDCLRKGLKIYSVPLTIAYLENKGNSWHRSNTREFYNIQGAIYYRMSKSMYFFLILQFAIRKWRLYHKDLSFFEIIKYMIEGAKNFKEKEVIK